MTSLKSDDKDLIVIRSVKELHEWRNSLDLNTRLGFVPTMGSLHQGHLSLVDRSVSETDITLVSIFVNSTQFSANEDLNTYPRHEKTDIELVKNRGCKVIFAPADDKEMYPTGYETFVENDIGKANRNENSEGASRPIFFKGVATILTKLFIISRPNYVYFGQKDAQQCAVVRKVIIDLNFDIKMNICETIRENDGLAMSSRNLYLTPKERKIAPIIYQALCIGKEEYDGGERESKQLKRKVIDKIEEIRPSIGKEEISLHIIYVSVCNRWSMEEVDGEINDSVGTSKNLICIAAMLGKTRLLDNVVL